VLVRQKTLRRVTKTLLRLLDEAEAEVCVGLVGDTRMRRLNRTHRNQDRTTDVLAFAYRETQTRDSPLLGDVVISVPTARRQAKALSHSLDEELLRLLIHGILHLVGYDHERSSRQAQRMRRKETELFQTLTPVPTLVVERAFVVARSPDQDRGQAYPACCFDALSPRPLLTKEGKARGADPSLCQGRISEEGMRVG